MKHAKKLARSKTENIFLIIGNDVGMPCYHYVMIDPAKMGLFKKLGKGDLVDILKFGTVLESGFGEPSEAVKKKMKEEYGYEE